MWVVREKKCIQVNKQLLYAVVVGSLCWLSLQLLKILASNCITPKEVSYCVLAQKIMLFEFIIKKLETRSEIFLF